MNNNGFSVPFSSNMKNISPSNTSVAVFQEKLSLTKHELFHGTLWNSSLLGFEGSSSSTRRGYSYRWGETVPNRYTDVINRVFHIQGSQDRPTDYLRKLYSLFRGGN